MTTLAASRIEYVRRVLIALGLTALAVALAWTTVLARGPLLLVYVSIVLAIGFGPLVRSIERQTWLPIGTARLPRWLAILVVYIGVVVAVGAVVALIRQPVADQAAEFWQQLPGFADRAQRYLMERGLLGRSACRSFTCSR